MELGPQFPKVDPGRHANGYSAGKDIHSAIGQNKKPDYHPKHAKGIEPPAPVQAKAPKPPAAAKVNVAKAPTKADGSGEGGTGKPGNATPRAAQRQHGYYHHHTEGMTERMHSMVGFQGDNGRTVA